MSKTMFSVGDILKAGDKRFRIVAIIATKVVLVTMDAEKLEFSVCRVEEIVVLLKNGELKKGQKEEGVFDFDDLPEDQKAEYETLLSLVKDVAETYGPDYLGLTMKQVKPDIARLTDKYGISNSEFWRIVRWWLQGGMKNSSLFTLVARPVDESYKYYKEGSRE